MKIYTRLGDGGETGLPGGRRVPKASTIFVCLGDLDETNAAIGQSVSYLARGANSFPISQLQNIQSRLLDIGACLAAESPEKARFLRQLGQETDRLESQIDDWDRVLPKLKNFILPGGSLVGAQLHYCRTLIRRAERSYHKIENKPGALLPISRYLNRLSDYFFQAARWVNHESGEKEQIWSG
jgi:cob(I)alamin adenosyltransferase